MTRHLGIFGLLALGIASMACQSEPRGDAIAAETTGSAQATTPAPVAEAPAHEGPQIIGHGEPVDLQKYLVAGQITVFDFMSEYCGPCRAFAPYLERLHTERDDMTVVKVDINRPEVRGIDFRSPLARQYGIHVVPSFKVYDAQGTLMAEGRDAQMMVISFIEDLPSLQSN